MKKRLSVSGRKRSRSVVMPPTFGYRSRSNSNNRGRKSDRLCLRPWMEDLLDKKECPMLRWVDKHRKIFTISWRHASRNGFNPMMDGDLFNRWAEHTGKAKRNVDNDLTNNKSTFRCALNSLHDCIQLTKAGDKKGEAAKRTYQFIDPGHPLYESKRKARRQKKCKSQPKEDTNIIPAEVIKVDTVTWENEQEAITWSSAGTFEGTEQDSNLDYLQQDSNLDYLRAEVTSPAIDDQLLSPSSSQIIVLENPFLSDSSALITSSSMEAPMPNGLSSSPLNEDFDNNLCVPNFDDLLAQVPARNKKIITLTRPDGVIAVELQNLDSTEVIVEQPIIQNNCFAVLSEPRVSEYETSTYHHPMFNSGGIVKVQTSKPTTLSQPEFVIDPAHFFVQQVFTNDNPYVMDDANTTGYNESLAEQVPGLQNHANFEYPIDLNFSMDEYSVDGEITDYTNEMLSPLIYKET